MTGILIFTAGRDDAYDDFKRSVKQGHPINELSEYLTEDETEEIRHYYEDDVAHLWGTSVAEKWDKVEKDDIALVYRDGEYIAQARVVHQTENIELARDLWDVQGKPWEEDNPWKYLTFLTDIEEIDVDVKDFNSLFGYKEAYYPMGFTRVAEDRLKDVRENTESIETAIAELTGAGEKKHTVAHEELSISDFVERLVEYSHDGTKSEEFEQLVVEAFTRLGFDAKWVEGGDGTDGEISNPIEAIIEAKTRSGGRAVADLRASNVARHRDRRNADYGFVVGPHFPPSVVEAAADNDLTTISAETLGDLVETRTRYGIPPEVIANHLREPGAVQDDRLDDLDTHIRTRLEAMEHAVAVLDALSRAETSKTPTEVQHILLGMAGDDYKLSTADVEAALRFLSYPGLNLLTEEENGFKLSTEFETALDAMDSLDTVLSEAIKQYQEE